jgi:hypothetical protein
MHRITTSAETSGIRLVAEFFQDDLRTLETPFGTVVELEGCTLSGEAGGPALPASSTDGACCFAAVDDTGKTGCARPA